ncbi:MAG TPA: glycosyltransferase family 39 protein [Acidimicrobiales bacterium]
MRAAIDEAVEGGHPAAATARPPGPPVWVAGAAVVAVVAAGVVLRFVQRSPLWLDEALSANIARLPVGDLLEALRHDGHPPLYYLLLHGWMKLVGEGDTAVRALSGILAVAALPLAWVAGRRLAGASGGRWALVVTALSPFLVRYATEARMYSLVTILVLGGYLLLVSTLEHPSRPRLAGLALVSGLLLLSHYWSFYLVAATGLVLAVRAWRRPAERPASVRALVALAAGGALFLPWLGGFLYQAAHTGTPWGRPFRPTAIVQTTLEDMGGGTMTEAGLYGSVVLALALLALFAARSSGHEVVLDLRTAPTVRGELAVVALVLGIGAVAGYLTSATFQSRYAAVVVPLLLLAVAVGITRLPGPARPVAGAAYVALALLGLVWVNHYQRTQSAEVAAAVAERASAGDVVVYCPDQLGPAYSREISRAMPRGLVHLGYPTLAGPELVDWVDYEERNAAADVGAIADEVRERAGSGAIFLVWMGDYRTFGRQCEELIAALGLHQQLVTPDSERFYEPAALHWSPAAGGG